jgi:hypothetical protein
MSTDTILMTSKGLITTDNVLMTLKWLMTTDTVLITAVRHIDYFVLLQVQPSVWGRAVLQKTILLQIVKQATFEIHFNIILPHRPTSSKWLFLYLSYQSRNSAPPTLPDTCLAPVICLVWSRDSYSVNSTKLHINATFEIPILLPPSQAAMSS